jgi:hypothetical protein
MSPNDRLRRCLLDPAAPCPPGLTTWNGSDPAQRFAVYRNNVIVSLVDALADTFPVTQELVGEPSSAPWRANSSAPRHRVRRCWRSTATALPNSSRRFPPAAGLPYLADVARLEMLRVLAWHAADACQLDLDVAIYRLAPGAACFVASLQLGLPFGEAATSALAADPDFDPAATLALLLGAGAIAGIATPRRSS